MKLLELFLVEEFNKHGLNLHRTSPSKDPLPYFVYDRLGGEQDVYPDIDEAAFSFDLYAKDMQQVQDKTNDILNIMDDLENKNGDFSYARVYNIVDNSFSERIIYTFYVRFLYRRQF